MEIEPNKADGKHTKKFPVLALTLGLLPSVFFLALIVLIRNASFSFPLKPTLFAMATLSLVCCVISSTMLFKKRTVPAIVGGLGLLILNTLITAFLGCTATISDMFR